MRDLVLLGLLPLLLYFMAKRPFIGLGMWIWTALFFPNAWVYGPASVIRYNLLFTGVAVLSYLAMRNKPKFRLGGLGTMVLVFFLWTTLSSMFTIGLPEISWDIWSRFAKIIMLFIFILLVVEKKLHVDFFLWCVVLSVGFYADLEGLKFILSGGGHKIEGFSGHVLGDRNELALAFVMTLPICYYLLGEYGKRSRLIFLALLGTMCLLVASVIGTQSRGGFIALSCLGVYLFIKSERKIPVLILLLLSGGGLSMVVTDEWLARMDTIESADDDGSFMGRVVAWKLSFIMAVRHPFLGGGFKSLEFLPNWVDLTRDFYSYPWFYTGDLYPTLHYARAAHSVYFQVLGEHGFVGLAIYLTCLGGAFFKAARILQEVKNSNGPEWIKSLSTMLQLSIFVFSVGGAALSFAYFDLIFAIFALLIVLEKRILPAASRELAK